MSDATAPRGRYAPSPTGHMTVGNAYTALRALLDVRSRGGRFVLRIDDTDPSRSTVTTSDITDELAMLGIDWDEGPDIGGDFGPYTTSERRGRHQDAAKALEASGAAYWDYTPPIDDVDEHKRTRTETGGGGRAAYRGSAEPVDGVEPVLRLKIDAGEVVVNDRVFGEIRVRGDDLGEVALLRADGSPTYHLASTVDDAEMAMTSIVRGADWLNFLPQHVLLFQAIGADIPEFAHIPLMLGKDGQKLSKRHGDLSIRHLLEDEGLPAPALCAYLANLGFAEHNVILTLGELADGFDLSALKRTSPRFDPKKLRSFARRWMSERESDDVLAAEMLERAKLAGSEAVSEDQVRALVPGVRTRISSFSEAGELVAFLDTDDVAGRNPDLVSDELVDLLLGADPWTAEVLEAVIDSAFAGIEDRDERKAKLMALRDALAPGFRVTPPLHYMLLALGPERARVRLGAR